MSRFLSLIEASKKGESDLGFNPPQWQHSNHVLAPIHSWDWANVAYILSLLVSEFLVKDGRLLVSRPQEATDLACLQWLMKEIRVVHDIESQPAKPCSMSRHSDPQRKIWVLAAACYALLLTSVSEPTIDSKINAETGESFVVDEVAEAKLNELRSWWHRRVAAWTGFKKLPWCSLSIEVLGKVAWLTTMDGEPVIAQLYRDGLSQIGASKQ